MLPLAAVFFLLVVAVRSQEPISIRLFHAIGDEEWTSRGRLVVNTKELVSQEQVILTEDQVTRFKQLANDSNQLYHVKGISSTGATASSFTRTCAIVQSDFNCVLTVYLDVKGQFMGIAVTSTDPSCAGTVSGSDRKKKTTLTTSVMVVQTSSGPAPDTQSYIQRMEQEKLEKMRGGNADNRSFLAKYWIYIVPLVIFMMISSASSPDGGGGGQ